ncbi:helix-turn-helix domain-containing protein [Pseudonocardia sp. RS11V-5]|uniref:helix-turn-helix domain-containing protein n=1 Tax=Pseudonocardia terrae TaxID=2905831 RepID=UPI001E52849A|nr:helix-turn-helix transcriptional regulator [Pseudonocardia terrae]MCE3555510.1 helix-turn-helix domain-containing protein [Pseudonocardia terrae]
MSSLLQEARHSRGWSSVKMRRELARAASRLGIPIASDASLRVLISRWENNRAVPDPVNQLLLQEVFGLDAESLGLSGERERDRIDSTGLVGHAARHLAVPTPVVDYFERQLKEHARFDNVAGPNFVLGTAICQLQQIEQLTSTRPCGLAALAAKYAEFTGWLHQDLGNDAVAVRLTCKAVDLAEMSGNSELTTYSRMRKANVLTAVGDLHLAASTAQRALVDAAEAFPQLMPVCLRQRALIAARLRDERGALEAIERAAGLADDDAARKGAEDLASYCTTSYVQMEAAHCLLLLRRPSAAEQACTAALEGWPNALVRDRSLCLARRGIALVELHEFDEACHAALLALEGVRSAPSGRSLHAIRVIASRLRPLGRKPAVRELTDALAEVA